MGMAFNKNLMLRYTDAIKLEFMQYDFKQRIKVLSLREFVETLTYSHPLAEQWINIDHE
jgi:hypothetical protein